MNKNPKLVMTLLVRDEEDIIRENIEFHLSHGVDFIIATDNASIDGTRDILAEFEKKGKLHLIDEPGRDKSQAAWNNRMTKIAIEQYGADVIFHCDADEFWCPVLGDLNTEIQNSKNDIMLVNLVNVVLENHSGEESFSDGIQYAVIKPIDVDAPNYENETKNKNLYFYRYPKKVIFKTEKEFFEVDQGNHNIINVKENILQGNSNNIFIFHFPLRGRERFYHKVIETGKAVEKNKLLQKGQSFHIRRWFNEYKDGNLDKEYEKLTVNKQDAEKLKKDGILADFNFFAFINNQIGENIFYRIQRNELDAEFNKIIKQKDLENQEKDKLVKQKEQEIHQKDQEISNLTQSVQEKEQEVNFVKSSKFWRARTLYLGVKFVFFSPKKFIEKYRKKIDRLYLAAKHSFQIEGVKVMIIRSMNFVLHGKGVLNKNLIIPDNNIDYGKRIYKNEELKKNEILAKINKFLYKPKISIITPVYDVDKKWLDKCIKSVTSQLYVNWELCLHDDASTKKETTECLKKWENKDTRIKISYGKINQHISGASNEALRAATGEFVAFLDNDDELTPDALYEVVRALNDDRKIDVLYSDEDKITQNEKEYVCPFFKPNWSPEFFRGAMYVGHFLVVKKTLAFEAGLLNNEFDRIQDYEFMLRLSERAKKISHIPKILYHWRIIPGSIAADSKAKGKIDSLQERAVNKHLERIGLMGLAKNGGTPHRVNIYPVEEDKYPLVSIIIPTKDNGEVLDKCLDSLLRITNYPDYEIILIDNNTKEEKAIGVMKKYKTKIIKYNNDFNFSEANNIGAKNASGEYLIFLNNDTEITDSDWIKKMLYYAKQKDVGAVGPMLIYPDGKVQHAGVVLGFRGTADHIMRGFPNNSDGYFGSLCCAREVSAVTAACVMIRKSVFEEVGMFNQHYQIIYQDVDLCLKIRKKNYRIIYTPLVKLIHYEAKSRGNNYNYLDRLLLLDLWEDTIKKGDPYYNVNFDLKKYSKTNAGYDI